MNISSTYHLRKLGKSTCISDNAPSNNVWDNAPIYDFPLNEMERILLQAARIVTGTNNCASKHLS